jgi:L-seryl-tRNA(Ser) seleniumtransferase
MQTSNKKSVSSGGKKSASGLSALPAISGLLENRQIKSLIKRFGRGLVTDLLREALSGLRAQIRSGELAGTPLKAAVSAKAIAASVAAAAGDVMAPRPRMVINATGVVVHTNLGRSLLSAAAADRVAAMALGYVDLEYDLENGRRGSRLASLAPLMTRLFPGHGFTVLNNNAAALMVCLRALGRRKDVVVSRGELVEIGGSFRVPDIMAASGARLCEVGTTNRTRLADYRNAITTKTGVILKVHTSNFRIVGFTEETPIASLAKLAKRSEIPFVVDWGSGDLVDLGALGIHDELPVTEVLAAGADLVTFSGDKLLGGPQAGFVVGKPELIERICKDPLARVCRLDRLMMAALHETLAAYVRGSAFEDVPTLSMLALPADEIGKRAEQLKRKLVKVAGVGKRLSVIDGVSRTGGGSSPTGERPTRLLAIDAASGDAGRLERALRAGDPPVIGRVQEGRLLLDLRTVRADQMDVLAERLGAVLINEAG